MKAPDIVYALKSEKDGRKYVGITQNLERRVKEHNSGYSKSTKGYCPLKLIFVEEAESRDLAHVREKY